MKETKMGEAVNAQVGRCQSLDRASDAHQVHEFINAITFCHEHQRPEPYENTAYLQREHGLDRPLADGIVPIMPADLIAPQDQRQRPADSAFGFLVRVSEAEEKQIQQHQARQCGDVCRA